ncbi:hypothetical protein BZL29_6582 [Mycobacterium kansasii]|uniref:Uncharacterized protein n=1 Tax=Mycobacterium kansasii TaxID=1768 RepID=A0A1V3WME3_MYCKA|nr:hypothetical protein BZL29_6582 [Mycobacterium kansasii]
MLAISPTPESGVAATHDRHALNKVKPMTPERLDRCVTHIRFSNCHISHCPTHHYSGLNVDAKG